MTWKIELELCVFIVKYMVNRNYHIVRARLILLLGVIFFTNIYFVFWRMVNEREQTSPNNKRKQKMREERFMVVPLHLQFIILLCDGCFVVILFVGLWHRT